VPAKGVRALAVPTDVADPDAVEALAQRAVTELGRLDVWVNDAAVMAYGAIGEVPGDVQRRIIGVNLLGTMHGARAALPHLQRQGRGVIVNVASLYAKMTSPYVSAYATSKYGVLGFSEVLRQELKASRGIHVCTVLPGSIDTPIFRHAANYTGQEIRPVPPVASPQRAARAIVRAAQHPRREITVGQLHHVASLGHALIPTHLQRARAQGDAARRHRQAGLAARPGQRLRATVGPRRDPWRLAQPSDARGGLGRRRAALACAAAGGRRVVER
jgi:NAD(P)-dependent dehydrogenase (short-subunit alcohol dehydrogenase family)